MKILEAQSISKSFGFQNILKDINFEIHDQEMVAITGASGSGKSTLLNILGLLETPDSGMLTLFGQTKIHPFSSKASRLLRDRIGFLFQNYALIDNKSVAYNLLLAIKKRKGLNTKEKIEQVLNRVGLNGFERKIVYQCSGGEQQRIAIARLLLKPCDLILADEPTGSLDLINRDAILDLLQDLKSEGKSIIIVTHDPVVAQRCDRIIQLDKTHGLD